MVCAEMAGAESSKRRIVPAPNRPCAETAAPNRPRRNVVDPELGNRYIVLVWRYRYPVQGEFSMAIPVLGTFQNRLGDTGTGTCTGGTRYIIGTYIDFTISIRYLITVIS